MSTRIGSSILSVLSTNGQRPFTLHQGATLESLVFGRPCHRCDVAVYGVSDVRRVDAMQSVSATESGADSRSNQRVHTSMCFVRLVIAFQPIRKCGTST